MLPLLIHFTASILWPPSQDHLAVLCEFILATSSVNSSPEDGDVLVVAARVVGLVILELAGQSEVRDLDMSL